MYHYDPQTALEELQEDAMLPNPVHIRDMIVRAKLKPDQALELNRKFQTYLQAFGDAQEIAKGILQQLGEPGAFTRVPNGATPSQEPETPRE